MESSARINLKALGKEGLERFVSGLGLPGFRARQLARWMYEKRASSIDEITEFSKPLRASLNETAYIGGLVLIERQTSGDGAEKFLFELEDGLRIESVLIPEAGRLTLCISTQVGCAMGCGFCLTAKGGFRRNLMAHEILEQALSAGRLLAPSRITGIVLMGMGEPLRNFEEVVEAVKRMNEFMGISKRRITISTSGLVKEMLALPGRLPGVNIAVSLNATTDAVRDSIMPVNRKYPIGALLEACRRYPLPKRDRITFEYVLIDGLNDSAADARRLVALLRGIPSKVNLIALNEFEGCPFKRPPEGRVLAFQKVLTDSGLTAFIRKSRGRDISAACGQLSAGFRKKA